MAGFVNASWEYPPPSQLNISSCDGITPWFASLLQAEVNLGNLDDIPISTSLAFLESLVPNNWTQPTSSDLMLWYLDIGSYFDNNTLSKILVYPVTSCGSQVCPYLDWDGDSDLSGIGMMISYYIAAVFVTIYYLMLLPKLFEACGRPMWISKGNNIYTRFVTGFEESVVGFLDALLFFAISMNVAAITRYASALQNPNESVSVYSLQDCVFLSAFSIFPAVVLQSLSVEVRRRRIRLFLWFLVMFFAVVLEVLYQGTYINTIYTEDLALKYVATPQGFVQYVWLSNCQSIPLWDQLTNLLTVGHVIMLFNSPWWLYFLLASVGAKRWTPFFQKRQRFWKIWSAVRFWLRVGNGLLCLIVMWVFLSLFTAYRSDIASKAGAADQDDEWTFGQVLSLVTWVPVGIDLVAIYIYGAKEGLTGKMSTKFQVVESTENANSGRIQNQEAYSMSEGEDKPLAMQNVVQVAPTPDPREVHRSPNAWIHS